MPAQKALPGLADCGSTTHAICDDFEGPFGAKWEITIGAPGNLQPSIEQAVSPTHALLVTIAGDAGRGAANVKHPFTVVNTVAVACDFELFVDTLSPTGGDRSTVFRLDMLPNVDSEGSMLNAVMVVGSDVTQLATGLGLSDGGYVTSGAVGAALRPGSWSTIHIDVDLMTRDFSVKRNGMPLLTTTIASTFAKNNGLAVSFGVDFDNMATKYFVDDVKCIVR